MICQPWIDEEDLVACGMCDTGRLSANKTAEIIRVASEVLYLLSGQQFPGQCQDQVRPCNCSPCGVLRYPVRLANGWANVCGSCGGYCGAGGAAILLPKRPVIDIISVLIDGAIFSDYRLDSPGYLVRTDGGVWPGCQNITLDTSEDGTWEVTYTYGKVPPASLRFAATVLSAELAKACYGDTTCRIPAGAVTVQRQGITYDFNVAEGRTGLYEVDTVLDAFNPGRRRRKARIYSPDDIEFARTTSGS